MKKKINFIGNFNDRTSEGAIKISNSLKKYFQKKYLIQLNKNPSKFKINNIHSSGIYESLINLISKKIIYSLHSNQNVNIIKILKDNYLYYIYLYSFKDDFYSFSRRITNFFMQIISNIIPIMIKRAILNKMYCVILPNKFLYKKLKLNNSLIIHHGINTNQFKPLKKIKNNKIKISFFGHPTPDKGIFEVLDLFKKIDDRYIYDKNVYPTKTNKKLKDYINNLKIKYKIHDFCKNIVKEYNSSDIIILPYRHALSAIATPLVLLEAMACERAIITTDLPHIKEICGDSVLYVKPYSVDEIVKKVEILANNPELRKKLGKKARERVVKYYNEEDMFKNYEKLYESILKN